MIYSICPNLKYGTHFVYLYTVGGFVKFILFLPFLTAALMLISPHTAFAQSNARPRSKDVKTKIPMKTKVVQTSPPSKLVARIPSGVSDSQKALEVKGQARNLSMMLVLKNRSDNIDFVKPRQNYNDEIKNTGF